MSVVWASLNLALALAGLWLIDGEPPDTASAGFVIAFVALCRSYRTQP